MCGWNQSILLCHLQKTNKEVLLKGGKEKKGKGRDCDPSVMCCFSVSQLSSQAFM